MAAFHEQLKKPLQIILADDDKDDREFFGEALKEINISSELTTTVNGQQLMELLNNPNQPKPDIIFLDINMPRKNGKECLREIKNSKTLKDIPCIMFSASNRETDKQDSYHLGADLYVNKPMSFTEMVIVINNIIAINWEEFQPPFRKQNLSQE